MTEDSTQILDDILNKISLDVVMVSPDNLVEVSELLGDIEPLKNGFAVFESPLPGQLIDIIERALVAVIRGEISQPEKGLEAAAQAITSLQDLARALPVGAPVTIFPEALKAGLDALIDRTFVEPQAILAQSDEDDLSGDEGNLGDIQAADIDLTAEGLEHFKAEFVAETEQLQVSLVAIEQRNEHGSALAELTPKFRALGAGASLLGLDTIALLATDAGELVEYVAADQVPYSTAVTDILLKACGYIIIGFSTLHIDQENNRLVGDPAVWPPPELDKFHDDLWSARQGFLTAAPEAEQAQEGSGASAPGKPKKLGQILIEKGLISEGELGNLIEAQHNARRVKLGDILVEAKLITQKELEEALDVQKQSPDRKLGEILVASGKLDYEQIDAAVKDQEAKRDTKLGEILVKSKIGAPDKVAAALREQKKSEGGFNAANIAVPTVKVETQKLDGLINLVGELVIAQSLITSNPAIESMTDQKITKDLTQVSRITSELQRNAMSLRMVPIRQTFQKITRLVRDLSHKFEKEVEITLIGEDTEIDRNMVESLYDPLVHLVRNALDHGLEPSSERQAKGKHPKGNVVLKAYHQSGSVIIELSDDGRGINEEKVLKKALEAGLIAPGEKLSSQAVHQLVFMPGFSTAEKVTEVSGRGVGMDVVKKSIERLRGKIDFSSQPDRGSIMVIRLPLTLAIIDGMIVRVGEHRYILPTISINESFRPEPDEYFTVKNQGEMIKVRESLLPLMRLDRLVEAEGALTDPTKGLVVVVENEGVRRCLMVDEVLGKQEVVIKSLGDRLRYVKSLAGGTILGDGRVGLILDVNGLFEQDAGSGFTLAHDAEGGDWDMEGSNW